MQIGSATHPYNTVLPASAGGTGAHLGPRGPLAPPSPPAWIQPSGRGSIAATDSTAPDAVVSITNTAVSSGSVSSQQPLELAFPSAVGRGAERGAALGRMTALNQAAARLAQTGVGASSVPVGTGTSSGMAEDASAVANAPIGAQAGSRIGAHADGRAGGELEVSSGAPAGAEFGMDGTKSAKSGGAEASGGEEGGEDGESESGEERLGGEERKSTEELTPDEQREVRELRQRDMEVRAHEQAHVAAGGRYVTKAPSYDYESGPDGERYAVGGEVSIDTSPVPGDPAATMEKAQVIRRAALAPTEPSTQDQRVASEARSMEAQARGELLQENRREMSASLEKVGDQAGEAADADVAARGGSARLQQRFAGFFATAPSLGLSQFA